MKAGTEGKGGQTQRQGVTRVVGLDDPTRGGDA